MLKPQREGGGNNAYGAAVAAMLRDGNATAALDDQILMERIFPAVQPALLVNRGRVAAAPALSELGVYSVFLGRSPAAAGGAREEPLAPWVEVGGGGGGGGLTVILNEYAGYLLRTKQDGVDEGGVASGFSCLSSIFLTADEDAAET